MLPVGRGREPRYQPGDNLMGNLERLTKMMSRGEPTNNELHSGKIEPCLTCGERDPEKLVVENIGISFGMRGDDYSFCLACYKTKTLKEVLARLCVVPLKLIREKS